MPQQRVADVPSAFHNSADGTSATSFVFVPFDPTSGVEKTSRRLPHWQQPGVTYFITWRLADAVSREQQEEWSHETAQWLKRHPKPWSTAEEAEWQKFFEEQQAYLDRGLGECLLARPELSKIVEASLRHFDDERYVLGPWVLMPNHVHLLVAPLGNHTLSKILKAWKGFTAKEINKSIGRTGTVWWDESFDHIVRDYENFQRFIGYIHDNPSKAGLTAAQVPSGKGKREFVPEVLQTFPSALPGKADETSATQ